MIHVKRTFGHEDASRATAETLATIIKNHQIEAFLDTQEKRYIVGPKGSGKTLLLLRKAIDQRSRSDGLCIPSAAGQPVDRLTATQHVGQQFNYKFSDRKEANLAWATVWKHSIYRSIVHHVRDELLLDADDSESSATSSWSEEVKLSRLRETRKLIDGFLAGYSPVPFGPFQYFTELGAKLDSSSRTTLQDVRSELLKLDALLSAIRRPIYVFLDNLDDYYEFEPDLWFNSMYGQFRAVREITQSHPNIHLFTSIRKDVYEQFADEMRLQYYDYVAHLSYTKDELLAIFSSHIKELADDLLARPELRHEDPWQAFFGDAVTIHNDRVDVLEHVANYIYRHTLGRPRDMVHMGTLLLDRRPSGGFTTDSVKASVRAAERDIANQYLAEIRPLLDPRFSIDRFLKNYVPSDVLNPSVINSMTEKYIFEQNSVFDPLVPSDLTRPFAALFELGLLGFSRELLDSKKSFQNFRAPGQGMRDVSQRNLPESELYFMHPVVHDWLPPTGRSKHMVIGNGLPVRQR